MIDVLKVDATEDSIDEINEFLKENGVDPIDWEIG